MKVLIAEDDPSSELALQRALEALGHACVVVDPGDAWAAFQAEPAEVVIRALPVPGLDALELCRRVRAHPSGYTYVLFTTPAAGKQHALGALRAGADDYLVTPLDLADLEARLLAASRVTSLHGRLVAQDAELARLDRLSFEAARTDPLTGVGNRLRLDEDLTAICGRAERYGHRYCAALCDLDHFKRYNDAHGRTAGDDALRLVARALCTQLRKGDAVYRFGGEEFLAIIAEQPIEGAAAAMERIRVGIESLGVPHEGKSPPGVLTMSVGIAPLDPATPHGEGWINRADEALYRAKALGRNRVVTTAAADDDDEPITIRGTEDGVG